MSIVSQIYLLVGALICVLWGSLAVSSVLERKARAAAISSAVLFASGGAWFGGYFLFSLSDYVLAVPVVLVAVFAGLFFSPVENTGSIHIGVIPERVDERDTMFAREEYQPGTERYRDYYTRQPKHRSVDDRIRQLPELLGPGGRYYDPEQSERIRSIFEEIRDMTTDVDGEVARGRTDVDPASISTEIKELVLGLGADDVGIARLNPVFVYSHVGRGPEEWGAPIENNHRYAIVFALEMDYGRVELAPLLPVVEESAMRYLSGARISIQLARYIRELGYPARAHISDSNYQIMLPPVAHDAGLGELGRLGYLISPRYGARIRLGGVTTDLPLVADGPKVFGVQDFCDKCRKCASNCPPAAIPTGDKTTVRAVEKWLLNAERCIQYWRVLGTDCGLCMRVCPYSHPPTFVHNLIRVAIRRSAFARTISVWGDDLLYGRQINNVPPLLAQASLARSL